MAFCHICGFSMNYISGQNFINKSTQELFIDINVGIYNLILFKAYFFINVFEQKTSMIHYFFSI